MLARDIYTKMQLVIHSIPLYFSFAMLCLNTACFPCLAHPLKHTHIHSHSIIPSNRQTVSNCCSYFKGCHAYIAKF